MKKIILFLIVLLFVQTVSGAEIELSIARHESGSLPNKFMFDKVVDVEIRSIESGQTIGNITLDVGLGAEPDNPIRFQNVLPGNYEICAETIVEFVENPTTFQYNNCTSDMFNEFYTNKFGHFTCIPGTSANVVQVKHRFAPIGCTITNVGEHETVDTAHIVVNTDVDELKSRNELSLRKKIEDACAKSLGSKLCTIGGALVRGEVGDIVFSETAAEALFGFSENSIIKSKLIKKSARGGIASVVVLGVVNTLLNESVTKYDVYQDIIVGGVSNSFCYLIGFRDKVGLTMCSALTSIVVRSYLDNDQLCDEAKSDDLYIKVTDVLVFGDREYRIDIQNKGRPIILKPTCRDPDNPGFIGGCVNVNINPRTINISTGETKSVLVVTTNDQSYERTKRLINFEYDNLIDQEHKCEVSGENFFEGYPVIPDPVCEPSSMLAEGDGCGDPPVYPPPSDGDPEIIWFSNPGTDRTYVLEDSNGDGVVQSGETVKIKDFWVRNTGDAYAAHVSARLSTNIPGILITDATTDQTIGVPYEGRSKYRQFRGESFEFLMPNNYCGDTVNFDVTFNYEDENDNPISSTSSFALDADCVFLGHMEESYKQIADPWTLIDSILELFGIMELDGTIVLDE